MRKLITLMTITAMASISTFQVVACKDNSQFDTFLQDVQNSETNRTAFFGFLGSADDEITMNLKTTFDTLTNTEENHKSLWQKYLDQETKEMGELGITNISLLSYLGPYHETKPNDIIDAFWNEKNMTWQRNIFDWVYTRTQENNQWYHNPTEGDVKNITIKKDDKNNVRFDTLPIVFIVSKGKLITAGQNWSSATTAWASQQTVKDFILENLLTYPKKTS